MITYKIIAKASNGDSLGEFQTFRNLQFGKRLNNYGTCSFQVPVTDDKLTSLIALREYGIEVYRNENLIWAGEQVNREGNLDNKKDNWATITCYDWFEQLNSRYTGETRTFAGVDAGLIAWTLIDESQVIVNGDFGITQGTLTATQNRDRTYNNKNIAEAIIELSNVINGFDFEINNSKVFNVYPTIGIDRSADIVLEYGTNVTSVRITEDFSHPVNKAIVLGDSGVPADPLRVEREDVPSEVLYKIREDLDNEMSVIETGTLEAKGDSILRKYGLPLIKVSMGIVRSTTPTIDDFSLGDLIRFKIKTGIYNLDDIFRIFEWQVNYNTDNTETLSLVLGDFANPSFG